MLESRIIPVLLIDNKRLVKTVCFDDPKYVGDPINAVRIFNEKEVDELIVLDISATRDRRAPDLAYIAQIASECFMPFTYGGGVRTTGDIRAVLKAGAEKICINTAVFENPTLIYEAAQICGSQSIVVSLDVRQNLQANRYAVYYKHGDKMSTMSPVECAQTCESLGAGELLIHAIDKEGTMQGFDTTLIRMIADAVHIPVIACGGAGDLDDFKKAFGEGHAHAVAAGSYFVFCGSRDAILITYPDRDEIDELWQ